MVSYDTSSFHNGQVLNSVILKNGYENSAVVKSRIYSRETGRAEKSMGQVGLEVKVLKRAELRQKNERLRTLTRTYR